MKKILFLPIFGVFLLVLSFPIHYVNAQEYPQTPVSGQYANSDYGVSITLPDGWSGTEVKFPSGAVANLPQGGTQVMVEPGGLINNQGKTSQTIMIILMAPKDPKQPILVSSMAEPPYGDTCNPTVTAKTVNSISLSEMVAECTGPVPEKVKMDMAQTDKYFINISFVATPSNYDSNVATLDTAVETLQVANSIEAPTVPGASQQPPSTGQSSQSSNGSPQSSNQVSIPSWIKNNAKWWSQNQIGDNDFIKGIQYLISQGILHVPQTASSTSSSHQIPTWIKNTAGWWANGQVSDDDFVKAIQYLISQGIISTGNSSISPNIQPPQHVQPFVNSSISNSIVQSTSGSASSNYLPFKRPPGPSSTNYQFITSWNENVTAGDGGTYDPSPSGVATDSSGNVYVTDILDNLVLKFDNNGKFINSWGYVHDESHGSCPGQFVIPNAIAIDSSNNVYVLDSGNFRIQKFDSNGNFITEWGAKYSTTNPPYCEIDETGSTGSGNGQFAVAGNVDAGLAVDQSGNVYAVDPGNDRIQKFDSNGNFITTWKITDPVDSSINLSSPQFFGIAVDPSGNVYLNTGDPSANVVKYSQTTSSCPAGTQLGSYSQNSVATNICFVKSWTTNSGRFATGPLYGIAIDSTGNLYVNSGEGGIQKFDTNGNFITSFVLEGNPSQGLPSGVAVDSSGNVFVIDYDNYKVQKFGPTP